MKKSLFLIVSLIFINLLSLKAQPVTYSWATSLGGKPNYDGNMDLAKDPQGNIYVTGEFTGSRSFGFYTLVATGFSEVFVAKFDPSGGCIWAVKAGANFSSAFGGGIAYNGAQVYVTGKFTNNITCGGQTQSTFGNNDAFIMQLDPSSGACNWIVKAGGTLNDEAGGVTPENSGGVVVCGTFTDLATFGSFTLNSGNINNIDMFIAKYNTDGTCAWVKKAGGPLNDKANAVKQLPGGAIFMTGYFQGTATFGTISVTSSNNYDFFLAKYDVSGNITYVQKGGGNGNDLGYSIGIDGSSNIYVSGFIGDTATFGTTTVYDNEYGSIIVAKYNNAGALQWIKTAGGTIDDAGYDISTDAGGSSYVTGYVNGNANFSGTPLTGVQARDGFVAKYDPSGTVRWVTKIGSSGFDFGKAIVNDANGFCYVTGDFSGNITLGTTSPIVAPPGEWGVYLVRLGGGTVGLQNNPKDNIFSVYPNPADGQLNFSFKNITDALFTVELLSIDGRLISTSPVNQTQVQAGFKLDTSKLPNGNYLVKISTSKGDYSQPLVIDHR